MTIFDTTVYIITRGKIWLIIRVIVFILLSCQRDKDTKNLYCIVFVIILIVSTLETTTPIIHLVRHLQIHIHRQSHPPNCHRPDCYHLSILILISNFQTHATIISGHIDQTIEKEIKYNFQAYISIDEIAWWRVRVLCARRGGVLCTTVL